MIDLLDRIRQAGGDVAVVGGDLRLRVPKGLLSQAERLLLAEHKAAIVKILAAEPVVVTMPEPVMITTCMDSMIEPVVDAMITPVMQATATATSTAEPVEFTTPGGLAIRFAEPDDEEEIVVPPPPCQQCGGFMFWWDFAGRPHCMVCERTTHVVGSKDPLRLITIDSARVREQAARIRRQAR
jgi:hypothetical protein